ncbi:MAG: MFS transporter [Hyphomicrobiales bacterium]|nr:MFS transporter [Hyphomicrobiales bacterium]
MLRLSALAPFRIRSYRFQWPADLLTSWALEMEFLILGWYVLVETGSVVMLTLYGAVQHGGTLIAPMMGVLSDRIGPRNLLTGMRAIYATIATTLMSLAFAGLLTPVLVLVLVGLMGIVRPSDLGLRATLIADTMPAKRLTGAMGMSRLTTDSSRIAGALTGAGLFASIGLGPTYVVIATFYVAAAVLTSRADSAHGKTANKIADPTLPPVRRVSVWSELREGVTYIRNAPKLLAIISLVLLFNLTAFPMTNGLLPYVARNVYQVDQAGLSYLIASISLGAMLGGVLMSRVSAGPQLSRLMIASAVTWYVLLLFYAQMQVIIGGIATLLIAGVFQSLTMVALTVILVQEAGHRFRGRVMGVRMLAIYTLPLGLLAAGALIERIGFAATATLYAGFGLATTLVVALYWRAHMWPTRTDNG